MTTSAELLKAQKTNLYQSIKIEGRTASHAGTTLTVFQGLAIIAEYTVNADATPGDLWELIHTDPAPKSNGNAVQLPVIRFNPDNQMHEVLTAMGERLGMANRESAARLIRRKLIQNAVRLSSNEGGRDGR